MSSALKKLLIVPILLIQIGCNNAHMSSPQSDHGESATQVSEVSTENLTEMSVTEINSATVSSNPQVELVKSGEEWNTWRIIATTVPTINDKPDNPAVFNIEFKLPISWELKYDNAAGSFFADDKSLDEEITKFRILPIYDDQNDETWKTYQDKAEYYNFIYSPENAGLIDKTYINNIISIEYVTVQENKWMLYCGFYPSNVLTLDSTDRNFIRAQSAYINQYRVGLSLDIQQNTMDDPTTKELVMTILESWKVTSVETSNE